MLKILKCTEERPSCVSCVRHGAECRYPNVAPANHQEEEPDRRPHTSPQADRSSIFPPVTVAEPALTEAETVSPAPVWADSLPVPELPRRNPASAAGSPHWCSCTSTCVCSSSPSGAFRFEMDDMVLLHHWTLFTSRDIYQSQPVDYCWQTVLPRIAFHHPFVMHGILSLAALHLAHTDPSCEKYRTLDASRHHNTSLQGFRKAINHVTDENSDALFAFSFLNIIYTFAILRQTRSDDDMGNSKSRNARVLGNEWIPMIRGVQAVLVPVYDRVRLGPLSPLTLIGNWDELNVESDSHPDDDTFRRASETWIDSPDAYFYDEALLILRRCRLYIAQFQTMDDESLRKWGYNRGWAGPLLFLFTAPEAYFTRLHQRQPQALVIFAYFGALLHGLNKFWFLEGWGREVVQVIDEILGDYWRPWMQWPRDTVGLSE